MVHTCMRSSPSRLPDSIANEATFIYFHNSPHGLGRNQGSSRSPQQSVSMNPLSGQVMKALLTLIYHFGSKNLGRELLIDSTFVMNLCLSYG